MVGGTREPTDSYLLYSCRVSDSELASISESSAAIIFFPLALPDFKMEDYISMLKKIF